MLYFVLLDHVSKHINMPDEHRRPMSSLICTFSLDTFLCQAKLMSKAKFSFAFRVLICDRACLQPLALFYSSVHHTVAACTSVLRSCSVYQILPEAFRNYTEIGQRESKQFCWRENQSAELMMPKSSTQLRTVSDNPQ